MDKQTGKIPDEQNGSSSLSDYALGLKILARIIARKHTGRIMDDPGSEDGVSKKK